MVITTLTFLTGGGRHRSASCKITKMTKWQNYESIFIFSVESVCREMLLMVDAHSELWLTRAFTLFSTFRRDAPFNQTVDTLHCRADGKDNEHTWEKWFLDMCVCVFAWYMPMSQPSEWCWCSAYCSHPLLHTHSHAHSAIVCHFVCSHDIYKQDR